MSDTASQIVSWAGMALKLAGQVSPLIAAGEAGIQVLAATASVITAGQATGSDPTPDQVAAQDAAIAAALGTLDAADDALDQGQDTVESSGTVESGTAVTNEGTVLASGSGDAPAAEPAAVETSNGTETADEPIVSEGSVEAAGTVTS